MTSKMKQKRRPITTGRSKASRNAPGEMDYFAHLEVIRWKILRILVFLVFGVAVSLFFIDPIIRLLKAPISGFPIELIYLKPYEKFLTYLKVALFSGLFLAIPYIIYQAGSFVYPAVKKSEKAAFLVIALLLPVVFFGGIFFSYKVLTPAAFAFFNNFAPGDAVKPLWSIGEYFDLLLSMLLVCGVLFQSPFVLLFLIRIKILSVETLARYRRFIIILIALVAGLFSPPDVVSQVLVGVPLYVMFELTVIIGRLIR